MPIRFLAVSYFHFQFSSACVKENFCEHANVFHFLHLKLSQIVQKFMEIWGMKITKKADALMGGEK